MGQLLTMMETIVGGRGAMLNGSGLISPSPMRILTYSEDQTLRWSTWLSVQLYWQTTELGSKLSLQMKESPSVVPSTDPIFQVEASLAEYPAMLAMFVTRSLLLCTSWTCTWGGIFLSSLSKQYVMARAPVSDRCGLVRED